MPPAPTIPMMVAEQVGGFKEIQRLADAVPRQHLGQQAEADGGEAPAAANEYPRAGSCLGGFDYLRHQLGQTREINCAISGWRPRTSLLRRKSVTRSSCARSRRCRSSHSASGSSRPRSQRSEQLRELTIPSVLGCRAHLIGRHRRHVVEESRYRTRAVNISDDHLLPGGPPRSRAVVVILSRELKSPVGLPVALPACDRETSPKRRWADRRVPLPT